MTSASAAVGGDVLWDDEQRYSRLSGPRLSWCERGLQLQVSRGGRACPGCSVARDRAPGAEDREARKGTFSLLGAGGGSRQVWGRRGTPSGPVTHSGLPGFVAAPGAGCLGVRECVSVCGRITARLCRPEEAAELAATSPPVTLSGVCCPALRGRPPLLLSTVGSTLRAG